MSADHDREPSFNDHFSQQAAAYARHRPRYPAALFDYLAAAAPGRALVWDCATGNGQAAVALAERFDDVFATDASAAQIASAEAHPRVRYAVEPAERCSLADHSADLVTVATALHWFATRAFFAEARRVLRPGGLLAAWTYGMTTVTPEVDAVIDRYYREIVGPYWPPERAHVERHYRDLEIPFVEAREPPCLELEASWAADDALGYLRSWSATQRYVDARGEDPREQIAEALRVAWGDAVERRVRWPLVLRVGPLSRT